MSLQKFYADPANAFTWPNGAIGYAPGGPFDCLGPFAKVKNCPIAGTEIRVTAYATGYATTYFSVPAACKVNGKYVGGYFTIDDNPGAPTGEGVVFHPFNRFEDRLPNAVED